MNWDDLVADVALSAGWTWDYVLETLTMSRLAALYRHWRRQPPTHKMAAAFCGYKPPADTPSPMISGSPSDPSGIGGLVAQFPDGAVPAWR